MQWTTIYFIIVVLAALYALIKMVMEIRRNGLFTLNVLIWLLVFIALALAFGVVFTITAQSILIK